MKQILALLLSLCFLLASVPAPAETADGTPVRLDGFTLAPDAGTVYQVNEKAENSVYITVYPYAGSGDLSTNFNFVWAGGSFDITVDIQRAALEDYRQDLTTTLQEMGYTVDTVQTGEPFETVLAGAACCAFDTELAVTSGSVSGTVHMRQFSVGPAGWVIALSATDPAALDSLAAAIDSMLTWD